MEAPRTRTDWLRLRQYCVLEAQRVLRHPEDAEEAAQEALLRVWRHRASRHSDAWMPWVRRIARNEALRIAAQRSRLDRRELHESADAPDQAGAGLEGVEESLAVRALLRPLREGDRALLRLRYEEDLTNPEIARRLGMPEGTVKVRLHRLRSRLRVGLEQAGIA